MEGRVDENNRSLLPNPFVSTVLIHPSKPSPPPPPAPLTLPQPLLLHHTPHKQATAPLKPILIPQTVKQKYTVATVSPLTNTQLRLNSVPAFILLIFVATGNNSQFWIACFVCLCKHILILHQHATVCVLEIAKYCFPFLCASLSCICSSLFCFCFVLATVHVMNALESNTVYSLQVFLCRGLVYEL